MHKKAVSSEKSFKAEVRIHKRNDEDPPHFHNTCGQIVELGKDYKLSQPIPYRIEYENGELIGSIEMLGIYEYAETLSQLNTALKSYIVRLYKMLENKEDKKLSHELLAQKRKLNSLISAEASNPK